MTGAVWIDGRIVAPADGTVAADDPGLLVGDGVFETTRVVRGVAFALTRHLARLRRSAAIVGIDVPWSDAELRGACEATVAAAGPEPADRFWRVRITVTARPTLLVSVLAAPRWPATTDLIWVDAPVNERGPLVGAKTIAHLESTWCARQARAAGVGEAVRSNTAGVLCEGSATNLFLVHDGVLSTPSRATGCLPGITRELVLEVADVVERGDLTVADLHRADEVFVTSSTRDVHPVTAVDGRRLAPAPGPTTAAVAAALAVVVATTVDP